MRITVRPDPCWTPGMERAAREWLELLDFVERRQEDGTISVSSNSSTLRGTENVQPDVAVNTSSP